MARTLTANFTTQATAASSAPYLILGIDWPGDGTWSYYLDRDLADFDASGTRAPATATLRVMRWPQLTISLKENQISATDTIRLSLWDGDKVLKALFDADPKQRRPVKIWRLFDDATTVWGTDELLVFSGATKPFSFRESSQEAEIECADISFFLDKAIGKNADPSVFATVDIADEDKILPVIFGRPRRVEGVLVKSPQYTQTLEQVATSGTPTFDIVDHPDDLGLATGSGNPYTMRLGEDLVVGYFTQSGDPDNTPSTFTITGQDYVNTGYAKILYTETTKILHVRKSEMRPRGVDLDEIDVGDSVRVFLWDSATALETTIARLQIGGDFGPDTATITLADALGSTNGAWIEFTIAFNDNRKAWPTGTPLIEHGARYEYIVNMLPSESVDLVESFGSMTDDSGDVYKTMIALDSYAVDLNNSEWSGSLGHNVTTVEFFHQPRKLFPFLDEDRIWVESKGIKVSGTYNENPFDLIVELLTNANLGNISSGSIDAASFATASAIADFLAYDYQFGWPMLEIAPVISFAQELAQQVHCVLQFDQGTIRIVVLYASAPSTVQSFDSDNILEQSLQIQESDINDLVSHVVGNWRRDWDDKLPPQTIRVWGQNSTIETNFRRRVVQIPFVAFPKRANVVTEVTFWLNRWGKVYRILTFTTFLEGLVVQPGDWINVDYTDAEANVVIDNEDCEVLQVSDDPNTQRVKIVCRYAIFDYT